MIEPAGELRASDTRVAGVDSTLRCSAPAWPYSTTRTGRSNATCSGWPRCTVRKRERIDELGVTVEMVTRWVEPVSHDIQPGRRTTTWIESRSPAGSVLRGQISLPRTTTGTLADCPPARTLTWSIVPPPVGIPKVARPSGPAVRLGLEVARIIAPAPSAASTSTRPATIGTHG